jgi:hypothetical protein
MRPDQKETIENIIYASNQAEDPAYKTLLSKKYIYVDPSGAYDLPKMEDVAALLKGRITELMQDPQKPVERPKELKQAMVFDLDTIT